MLMLQQKRKRLVVGQANIDEQAMLLTRFKLNIDDIREHSRELADGYWKQSIDADSANGYIGYYRSPLTFRLHSIRRSNAPSMELQIVHAMTGQRKKCVTSPLRMLSSF